MKPTQIALSAAFVVLASAGAQAADATPATLQSWGASLAVEPRLVNEMSRFADNGGLSTDYRQDLATRVKNRMFARADQQVQSLRRQGCHEGATATFMKAGFAGASATGALNRAEIAFEGAFVEVEAIGCIPKYNARVTTDAVRVITSTPEFRKATLSQIRDSQITGDMLCESTNAEAAAFITLLGPTHVCMQSDSYDENGLLANHSKLVWNDPNRADQPIYYRESVMAYLDAPNEVIIYGINNSRVIDFGMLDGFAEGELSKAQSRGFGWLRTYFQQH